MKISKQTAPATPPICVREKKTKKAAPNTRQTHGCAAGLARRKRIAAGTRKSTKYAKVLKIMRDSLAYCRKSGPSSQWGEDLHEGTWERRRLAGVCARRDCGLEIRRRDTGAPRTKM